MYYVKTKILTTKNKIYIFYIKQENITLALVNLIMYYKIQYIENQNSQKIQTKCIIMIFYRKFQSRGRGAKLGRKRSEQRHCTFTRIGNFVFNLCDFTKNKLTHL